MMGWQEILTQLRGDTLRSRFLRACADALALQIKTIAEIGVHKGVLSRELRQFFPEAHLTLVDPWRHIPDLERLNGTMHRAARHDPGGNAAEWARIFAEVQAAFKNDPAVRFIQALSAEAAPQVPDESLDLCYIDGDHRYQFVVDDIRLWTPKIKPGGLLCGHDYKISRFPNAPLYQVVAAVNDTLGRDNIVLGRSMQWLWRKPCP